MSKLGSGQDHHVPRGPDWLAHGSIVSFCLIPESNTSSAVTGLGGGGIRVTEDGTGREKEINEKSLPTSQSPRSVN